jgi:hypothetical protein
VRSTCPPTLSLPIGNDRRCPPVPRVHGDPRRSPLLLPRAFVFFVHLSPSSLASDLRGLQSAQSRRSAQSADRRAASLRLAAVPALVVSLLPLSLARSVVACPLFCLCSRRLFFAAHRSTRSDPFHAS